MVDFNREPLEIGNVTISEKALAAIGPTGLSQLFVRHTTGDWGTVDAEIAADNFRALVLGQGIVSSTYQLSGGRTAIIVTEIDPRQTSVLLAEEI